MPGKGARATPGSSTKAANSHKRKDNHHTHLPSSGPSPSKLQVLYQLARQIVDGHGTDENGNTIRPGARAGVDSFIARYDAKYEDIGDMPPLFDMGSMPGSFNPSPGYGGGEAGLDQPLSFDPAMFSDPSFLKSLEQAAEVLLTVPDLNETEWKEWREEEWRERMAENGNIHPDDVDFIDERTHVPPSSSALPPHPHHSHLHSHNHPHDSPAPHQSRPPAHPPPPKKPPNNRKPTFTLWTPSERARISAFWLNLNDAERRDLVNIERDSIYRKLKESQKHSCGCEVCVRTRSAIEEEFEVLFDAYSDELDEFTRRVQGGLPLSGPGPFPGSLEFGPGGKVVGAKESLDPSELGAHTHPPPDPVEVIIVADDLIRNDGRKFSSMMENFMVRRLYLEDGRDTEASDSEAKLAIAEKKMDEENKETFFVFAARMFEQRVLQAYRELVAHERQRQLLRELELEETSNKEKEAKKQEQNAKKKDKKKQQKQLKDDEKAQKAAELAAKEAELQSAKDAALAVTRKKKEEEKTRRDALNRATKEEETRRRKETARLEALGAEKAAAERRKNQEEIDRVAKEAKRVAAERAAVKAQKERERLEQEEREAQEAKEEAELEVKEKADARLAKKAARISRNNNSVRGGNVAAGGSRGRADAKNPPATAPSPIRQQHAVSPPPSDLYAQYARATEFTPLQTHLPPSTGYYHHSTPATPTYPHQYSQQRMYSPPGASPYEYGPPGEPMQHSYGQQQHPPLPSPLFNHQQHHGAPPGIHQSHDVMGYPLSNPVDPQAGRLGSILQWRASVPEDNNSVLSPPTPIMDQPLAGLVDPIAVARPPPLPVLGLRAASPIITGSSALHADDDEIVIPQGRRVVGQGWGR